jgi:hypothetical protein
MKFHIFIIVLWVAGLIGWVLNIMTIFNTINLPINGEFILRIIGVPMAPLGAILGYF